MSQAKVDTKDISRRVRDALVEEFGESQDACVRGFFPSQSLKKVMEYLDADQIQELKARRRIVNKTESFKNPAGQQMPPYFDMVEKLKQDAKLHFDRSEYSRFDWAAIFDGIVGLELTDLAVEKLVFVMDNSELRNQLFSILQTALNYPDSYRNEFTDRFYFVMESRAPELQADYDAIKNAHDSGELKQLGWRPRSLDLVAIWSYRAWANPRSGNQPFNGINQHEVEEFAFNQRQSDQPIFGAVNSKLVVNRWRQPFGRGLTEMKPYRFEADQRGWVRADG